MTRAEAQTLLAVIQHPGVGREALDAKAATWLDKQGLVEFRDGAHATVAGYAYAVRSEILNVWYVVKVDGARPALILEGVYPQVTGWAAKDLEHAIAQLLSTGKLQLVRQAKGRMYLVAAAI